MEHFLKIIIDESKLQLYIRIILKYIVIIYLAFYIADLAGLEADLDILVNSKSNSFNWGKTLEEVVKFKLFFPILFLFISGLVFNSSKIIVRALAIIIFTYLSHRILRKPKNDLKLIKTRKELGIDNFEVEIYKIFDEKLPIFSSYYETFKEEIIKKLDRKDPSKKLKKEKSKLINEIHEKLGNKIEMIFILISILIFIRSDFALIINHESLIFSLIELCILLYIIIHIISLGIIVFFNKFFELIIDAALKYFEVTKKDPT